jgi:nitrogen regulatory protein P-II 1
LAFIAAPTPPLLLAEVLAEAAPLLRAGSETFQKYFGATMRRGDGALTKVQAIIREQRLEAVVERLVLIGVRGLTLYPVKGAGRSGGRREVFRGSAYQVSFLPKMSIEWYGPDDEAHAVVRAIEQFGRTDKIGDGKIFVIRIDEAVRIRTGERGVDAV